MYKNNWYLLFFLDECLLSWLEWNPIGFSSHNYVEMHGQQNIKKKNMQQVSSFVTTEFPVSYVIVITKQIIRFRNNLLHMIKKTLPRYVGLMKLMEGSQD